MAILVIISAWSYVNGRYDNLTDAYSCPCACGGPSPPFVSTNYYCESRGANTYSPSTTTSDIELEYVIEIGSLLDLP